MLDVEVLEATPERVVMRLPVDWRVHQPYGILHGGVSALLAESAASFGAALAAGTERSVVGIELNASHLRSVREGHLTAEATPVRVGRTVQVWRISLHDDAGRAICEARCTLSVLARTRRAVRRRRCRTGRRNSQRGRTGVLCRCDPGGKWSARPIRRTGSSPYHAGRTLFR